MSVSNEQIPSYLNLFKKALALPKQGRLIIFKDMKILCLKMLKKSLKCFKNSVEAASAENFRKTPK